MCWADIDFEGAVIHVHRQQDRHGVRAAQDPRRTRGADVLPSRVTRLAEAERTWSECSMNSSIFVAVSSLRKS